MVEESVGHARADGGGREGGRRGGGEEVGEFPEGHCWPGVYCCVGG